jgi:hypothetical protein
LELEKLTVGDADEFVGLITLTDALQRVLPAAGVA